MDPVTRVKAKSGVVARDVNSLTTSASNLTVDSNAKVSQSNRKKRKALTESELTLFKKEI